MPAIAYRLTVTYNDDGQFAQNVFHYSLDDSGFADASSAALSLINAFVATAMPHLQAMLPVSVQLLSIKARAIDTIGGFEAVLLLPGGTVGSRTGTQQVSGVGPCLTWFPTNNSRTRGKTFLPGVTDSDLVDGFFQTAFRNICTTHAPLLGSSLILTGGGSPTATFVIRQTKPTYSLLPVQYVDLAVLPVTLRKRQRPA